MGVLKQSVDRASRMMDRVVTPPPGITILIYHRVGGGSDSAVDLDPGGFDRQLAHLAEHHRVLSLADAVAELSSAQPSGWAGTAASSPIAVGDGEPPSAVVVTFDDGTTDFVDVAAPLLERHRIPATLYAATHFIDTGEPFPWGAPPATWTGLRDVAASGLISIESHTHQHFLMDRIDRTTIVDELDRSIELIGEHLGRVPEHFAYPKAVPGSAAAEVEVRRRFASATLARNRVNRPGHTDLHRLWRTPLQRRDDIDAFARRAAGGMRLEGEIRAWSNPLRYRGDAA